MSRSRVNFVLDAISLLVMLALIETGVIMKYLLPPGSGHGPDGGPGLTLLGWNRHGWGGLHWWLAVGLAGLMLVHVALHWSWVCVVTGQIAGSRRTETHSSSPRAGVTGSGVAFLLAILVLMAGAILWASRNLEGEYVPHDEHVETSRGGGGASSASEPHGTGHTPGDRQVCGRLTLEEIARNTGVSSARILEELGLAPETPTNVKLGELAAEYDFAVPEVREIVNRARAR